VLTYNFPPEFLWGASTSSHQVEGNNRWNDWWEYEQLGRVPFTSGAACRHYQLFEQDFDLARSMGHNAHRLSLEWSRIEPEQGRWNMDAIDHYRRVIQALRDRGLEPVVTLHHFTNPAWFTRSGGWLRRDSSKLFARYAEHVAHHLGSQVRYWLTLNEPTVYVMQGYVAGEWPPCLHSAWAKAARVFRNLARAHIAAFDILHERLQRVQVGFAHSTPVIVPCNSNRLRDRFAAAVRDLILNRAFFFLIGARGRPTPATAAHLDFIGVNYYTRHIVRAEGWGLGAIVGRACAADHHPDIGPLSTMGWESYPAGLGAALERLSHYGVPLLITENGVATDDEALRREFLRSHLRQLGAAIEQGVNVVGYLYWSLIDNFEWALGTTPHFGLAAVNYETQERIPRPCLEDFRRVCVENRVAREAST